MIDFTYNGSYPLERLKAPKGHTFKECTIRKWTPRNCRIAARRRCHNILSQLLKQEPDWENSPNAEWFEEVGLLVSCGEPRNIEAIESALYVAIESET